MISESSFTRELIEVQEEIYERLTGETFIEVARCLKTVLIELNEAVRVGRTSAVAAEVMLKGIDQIATYFPHPLTDRFWLDTMMLQGIADGWRAAGVPLKTNDRTTVW